MKQSVVGIVKDGNRFLLGLRLPGGEVGNCWEFPGGKCEAGETHEQALVREYDEELGVRICVGDFIAQKTFKTPRHEFELFAYEVQLDAGQTITSAEHADLKWFFLDELETIPVVPSDAQFIPVLRDFYKL
ncbi:MAG: NUDIX domain-containing protein [Treponema sp.]